MKKPRIKKIRGRWTVQTPFLNGFESFTWREVRAIQEAIHRCNILNYKEDHARGLLSAS